MFRGFTGIGRWTLELLPTFHVEYRTNQFCGPLGARAMAMFVLDRYVCIYTPKENQLF